MKFEMLADMEVDKMADMEVDMLANMEVDMVADINININMEIQFGERVGHSRQCCLGPRDRLIGPKLFQPEAYLTCVSSISFASLFLHGHRP